MHLVQVHSEQRWSARCGMGDFVLHTRTRWYSVSLPSWGRARCQTFAYGRRQPQSTLRVYAACCCCSTLNSARTTHIMRTTTKSGEYLLYKFMSGDWWPNLIVNWHTQPASGDQWRELNLHNNKNRLTPESKMTLAVWHALWLALYLPAFDIFYESLTKVYLVVMCNQT